MSRNVPDLLDYLRSAYNPNVIETYDERINQVREASILILDDLGTQNATPWAEEKLYQILNYRYVHKRSTVITTNVELDDLDPRLRSRLSDVSLVRRLNIVAPDYRLGPNNQEQSTLAAWNSYKDKSFANFKTDYDGLSNEGHTALKYALDLAKNYAAQPEDWLAFVGDHGIGKTHLAAAIANYCAKHGNPTTFVVVPDLLDHLRATYGHESRNSFDLRKTGLNLSSLAILSPSAPFFAKFTP